MRLILFVLLSTVAAAFAADDVIPAAELAKKWKRTKSFAAPVEKLRKGIEVEFGRTATSTPVEVKVDADTVASFQNIQFLKDSADLAGTTTFAQLAEIAKAIKAAGTEHFLIEGHTCDLGGEAHNLELSQRRALAVKTALTNQGVSNAVIQVIGFGECDPAVANTDEAARSKNRRVQIFRKL